MQVLDPSGAVNLIVLSSMRSAVITSVVAGSHVAAFAQRTVVPSFVSKSLTVYSVPGVAIHLMPHPTVPLPLDHPNLMLDGSAYS